MLLAVVEHCEQLAKLILDLKQQELAEGHGRQENVSDHHPRECVPASEQELIIGWLGGINLVSGSVSCLAVCPSRDVNVL